MQHPEQPVGSDRLIVVSNRLPVTLRRQEGGWRVQPSSGGLVTAMEPILRRTGGLWVGWPGDASALDEAEQQRILDGWSGREKYVVVGLPARIAELYYEGYCNQTIWPLFHYFPLLLVYDPRAWEAYVEANRRFCDTLLRHIRPSDFIWIHDYQLMLLPLMVREAMPEARIGFFLHIPFPSSELFRLLPGREELLHGLLGADLVAFQTHGHLQHFRSSLLRILGLESQLDNVDAGGRAAHLEALPIGIAPGEFRGLLSASKETREYLGEYRRRFEGRRVLFAVDRLDHTKGIPERLRAYRRLLLSSPELRRRVVLIQVAVPSRERVASYARLRREVNELVGEINGQFATPEWTPVVYLRRGISRQQLVALYHLADVGWVTPLRDGMNLVAKEYVATNAGAGVLVLSELAGAAAEMGEALLVNPFDEERAAATVRRALEMPEPERRSRMEALRRRVEKNNVYAWGDRFLAGLAKASAGRTQHLVGQPPLLDRRAVAAAYRAAARRLLLFSYDGTLVPASGSPEQAAPPQELLEMLAALSADPANLVALVTGRRRDDLERWFSALGGLWLAAEHGAFLRPPGRREWLSLYPIRAGDWKPRLLALLEHMVERAPGSLVEEKENSVVWHYRMSHPEFAEWLAAELMGILEGMLADTEMNAVKGRKYVEIRPVWADKGRVVSHLLGTCPVCDFALAAGDDRVDEEMFSQLDADAWTVRVGKGDTRARFYVPDPSHIRDLLRRLLYAGPLDA